MNNRLYDILDIDFEHCDEKGKLLQLVHGGYKQVNILVTRKGAERGGHYHAFTKEAFYVISGIVEVLMYNDDQKVTKIFREGDFFLIYPFVVHEMKFLEDTAMIALYTESVELDDGTKDINIVD